MFGYLTRQYHLQTYFAVVTVRTMHQTSILHIKTRKIHAQEKQLRRYLQFFFLTQRSCSRQVMIYFIDRRNYGNTGKSDI